MSQAENKVIPEGYKQTEIGVIPEDWQVAEIVDISSKVTDGTHDTPSPVREGVPFLTAIHIKENNIAFESCYYLPKSIHDEIYRRCNPEFEDVLMVNIGAGTGTTALVTVDYPFSLKNVALIKPNKLRTDGRYLNQVLSFQKNNILDSLSAGGAQPFLSLSQISQIKISTPCKKEQTAIANALSDVDALLSELEKLIAKKQAMKTATMQQLLTGKNRLPQFAFYSDINSIEGAVEGKRKGTKPSELGEIPDDWEVKKFGQVMRIRHGKDQKSIQVSGGLYPIFGTGGQMGSTNTPLYDKPSVLIGRKGTINKPRFTDYPFWTVDTLFYSEVANTESVKFIYYKFCMIDWMQYNEASGVPSLNASTIENVLASFPDIKEQTAIVTILSDIDNEIQAFEQRLSKTRQIKQGMMQELLTGKTRLPLNTN